ncbi:ECF transporter S component [Clostridium bovifaecis]|uniref:ECF transporter S component n=1 Tax=Clostridium bovifaecis TaxID=2184719 RepID=A0A6I6F7Q4_9CLOT|nr:ECF transporter S component [Clostridium bovifaecis]
MERNLVSTTTRTRKLTTFAMLAAISAILGLTPLGIIPIPPVGATIMHIPVIITAILEGPILGALMGLVFGIISFVNAIIKPTPLSFAAMNPLVSIFPRMLIGVVAYYVYKGIPLKNESIKVGASAALATLMNTVGFLGMMYLLYAEPVAKALGQKVDTVGKFLLVLGTTHGLPEMGVAIVITIPIVFAVRRIKR